MGALLHAVLAVWGMDLRVKLRLHFVGLALITCTGFTISCHNDDVFLFIQTLTSAPNVPAMPMPRAPTSQVHLFADVIHSLQEMAIHAPVSSRVPILSLMFFMWSEIS